MAPDAEPALTLRAAAKKLSVTPQRVSQLLHSGELEGPEFDGKHAPKDVGRVWSSSLDALMDRRRDRPREAPATGQRYLSSDVAERLAAIERSVLSMGRAEPAAGALVSRERAAREVALQLKVEADLLRDQLTLERAKSADLTRKLAALQTLLDQVEVERDANEASRAVYDQALSTMLAAGDIGEL